MASEDDTGLSAKPGGNEPITSRELARSLGISQSTISRAFTEGASISPKMRKYVLESAEELGYQPNAIASILSRRRSDLVGVVVSDMQNPFYPALLDKLSRALQENGRRSLLFSAKGGNDVDQQLLLLRQYSVESVVVLSASISSGAAIKWAADGRNIILINRSVPDAPVSSICCDNGLGATTVAEHFHALGHRRVAYVAGRADTSTNVEREDAFARRVEELGMTLAAKVSAGEYSYEAGYAAALEVARTDVQAIFFANDILAIGGLDALRDERGLRVPEDVSVVGFDDIEMAAWPRYRLTTMRQPVDEMVAQALGLITGSSEKSALPPTLHRIPGSLVLRSTTQSDDMGAVRGELAR